MDLRGFPRKKPSWRAASSRLPVLPFMPAARRSVFACCSGGGADGGGTVFSVRQTFRRALAARSASAADPAAWAASAFADPLSASAPALPRASAPALADHSASAVSAPALP